MRRITMTALEFRRQFIKDRYRKPTDEPKSTFSFVKYAWPGGYPLFLVTSDGGCLCAKCVDEERGLIHQAALEKLHGGWRPLGVDVNWEDPSLFCDHCSERIESAYAEEDVA
jgi:hypothetical protein